MTDNEFLGYCEIHCETDLAMFSRAQLDRLRALAGYADLTWKGPQPEWYSLGPDSIMPVVKAARTRLEKTE